MREPQEVRTKLAKSNEEKIRQLTNEYVDMFLEQLERNNARVIMYPATVHVELVQDMEKGTMKNEVHSAEFNLQALSEARNKLKSEKGYKVRIKGFKFFAKDYKDALAWRLCGKVRIEKK